jgi:hypothetical protein
VDTTLAVEPQAASECTERDELIHAYLAVVRKQADAAERLNRAVTEDQLERARGQCEEARQVGLRIRHLLVKHCGQHGC